MKRFSLILKILFKAKFIFKNPPKKKIIIFDDVGIYDLKNLLQKYNYYVLQVRSQNIDKVYITFKVIKYFLKNYKGSIMTSYLVSMLEIMHPKIVITSIDNSFKFSDIARILEKKMHFVAIQNASRFELRLNNFFLKKKIVKNNDNKRYFLPNFFCFGQFEIDEYRKFKVEVKNFFKVGGVRLANFFHYIKKKKIKLKNSAYDICYSGEDVFFNISDWLGVKNAERDQIKIAKYLIKFCIKHNLRLITTIKYIPKNINNFNLYKEYLTKDELRYLWNSLYKSKILYKRYQIIAESKVVVGTHSTQLREKLAMGGKILCCNLSTSNAIDFPNKGICFIKNFSYEEFESRLLKIYKISKKNYYSQLKEDKEYTMLFNKKTPAFEIIRKKINELLNKPI